MDRPEQVNRQQLYDAVWTEPVSTVAARYGLSDVRLAKICKKLRIPVPSRGYWAKVKAGASLRRPALPNVSDVSPTRVTLPSIDSTVSALRIAAKQEAATRREATPAIDAPTDLQHPHPLIRAASARLKQRDGWTDEKGLRSAPAEVLHIDVTRSALDRALLLMDTLVKALAERSIAVRVDTQAKLTMIDAEGTSVPLVISEHVRRTNHELTPAEQKARERYTNRSHWDPSVPYPHTARYDYRPTGVLTVTAGRWPCRAWKDTAKTPLERRLGEIVVGIVTMAAETKAREDDEARRREAHRLAQERYAFLQQRLAQERADFEQLETEATNWDRARRLRAYIHAVEQQASAAGDRSPEHDEWIAWARAKADGLDPLVPVCDPILGAPEPKPPGYLW